MTVVLGQGDGRGTEGREHVSREDCGGKGQTRKFKSINRTARKSVRLHWRVKCVPAEWYNRRGSPGRANPGSSESETLKRQCVHKPPRDPTEEIQEVLGGQDMKFCISMSQ